MASVAAGVAAMSTAAKVSAAAAAISAAVSAGSAIYRGAQAKKMADYNAEMAELQAQREKESAAARAEQYRKDAQRRMSSLRAGYLASGVGMEGTPLLALMESAQEVAKNEERIRRQGEMTGWGLLSESSLNKMKGDSAMASGVMGAGTSLLGGASRTARIFRSQ